jgi:uncharacterized membrane protein
MLPVIAMSTSLKKSTKETIIAVLVITGVVVYLYVFHFLLGMTWMIYVLVIAVLALMIVRKMVALKKQKARVAAATS